MGDIVNGIGNAIGSAVDSIESAGSDVLSAGGKLLGNPAIDTAIGSMFGCPELGMVAPIISGLTGQGGSASPTSLGQPPSMFGGGNPFGGVLDGLFGGGGAGNIPGGGFFGSGGLGGILGGGGLPGLGGGNLGNDFPPISGFPPVAGGGAGLGSGPGLPGAGNFNPAQLQAQQTANLQMQMQMTAIQEAFDLASKEISMMQDMHKSAIQNIH